MVYRFTMNSAGKIIVDKSDFNDPAAIILTHTEREAVDYVLEVIEAAGGDMSKVSIERTEGYVKICYGKFCLAFCRLKLGAKVNYLELTISTKQAKLLINDPRFFDIQLAKKRFTRIPITYASDIPQYNDVILGAFQWGTINCDGYD